MSREICRECHGTGISEVDYKEKYHTLRSTIQDQLRLLAPWYLEGRGCGVNIAVNALKSIDRAVKTEMPSKYNVGDKACWSAPYGFETVEINAVFGNVITGFYYGIKGYTFTLTEEELR